MQDKIDAIFWVSAWAMIAVYWASWWNVDSICERYISNISKLSAKNLKLPPITSLMQEKPILSMLNDDLPETFSQLDKKIYIGATDLYTGSYQLFSSGEIVPVLMWSIALPVIFPPVVFRKYLLADGWIIDNFPVLRAKKLYPNHEIIGITVSEFKKNQKVTNLLSSALVSFNLMLSRDSEANLDIIDHCFIKDVKFGTTETNVDKLKKAYETWYKEWIKYFQDIRA